MVRRYTKREDELREIYRPYLCMPDGFHPSVREDAPQEAKDAFEEAMRIDHEITVEILGFDWKKTAK